VSVEAERKRTQLRHTEVAVAAVLWGVVLPLVLLLVPLEMMTWLSILLFAVFTALIMHAVSLRPFCVDKVNEEQDEDLPPDQEKDANDSWEEVKLMLTALVLLSGVGGIVCLVLGGDAAFRSWMASGTLDCSVTDLEVLQEAGTAKFFCQDGFVDVTQQASILTKGTGFRGGMRIYRIAPVFESEGSKSLVAWSVTRDQVLSSSPCDGAMGLCGLFLQPASEPCMSSVVCFTPEERGRFTKMQGIVTQALQTSGVSTAGAADMPLVVLTDPHDPLGNMRHLLRAVGFWAFTFIGILAVAADALLNEMGKSKGSYESLLDAESPGPRASKKEGSVNVKFSEVK